MDAFHGFFLSSLGKHFLNSYYCAALKNDKTIAVGAFDDKGQIQGFATGCIKSKEFHNQLMMNNLLTFIYHGSVLLFTNPKALLRLLLNLDKIHHKNDDGNYAELISIGVYHTIKGMGIGKTLVKTFEDEAKRKGCQKITLTTDYYKNQDTVNFYFHSGYKVFYEFYSFPKRKMYKLIKDQN